MKLICVNCKHEVDNISANGCWINDKNDRSCICPCWEYDSMEYIQFLVKEKNGKKVLSKVQTRSRKKA